ncbi:hypothetical protein ARMGADRAFT_1087858 [Armillaria gallica]|uniref:Uncharacterized protein n=1 Tax=Armillaria gallica TaxID=47427 RepID=A0A2H3DBU4_ARMGA|nr:hypothetical protein ARMGADRAFT_1087858 [Armillaria gallica]
MVWEDFEDQGCAANGSHYHIAHMGNKKPPWNNCLICVLPLLWTIKDIILNDWTAVSGFVSSVTGVWFVKDKSR